MDPDEVLARLAESGTPPDAESALRLSVGLDDEIARFENETLPFIAAGGTEVHFIFAPYGRGKTHLLLTLKETALRHNFVTAYIDCKTDRSPFTSLPDTYRQIAYNLYPPYTTPDNNQKSGIEAVIRLRLERENKPLRFLNNLYKNPNIASDFRNSVIAYGRSLINPDLVDLKYYLGSLLNANASVKLSIPALYRQYPWLPKPLGKLSSRNAASWVRAISSLPLSLGYSGLIILFDETEKTRSFKNLWSRDRLQYWANLRNLIDHLAIGSYRGCIIYFAVVEEFLEMAHQQLGALSQRIERMRFRNDQSFPNPRAVWVNLDELTNPSPDDPSFFRSLSRRIVSVGVEGGLTSEMANILLPELNAHGEKLSRSINEGVVREFVKFAASKVAVELRRIQGRNI